MVLLICGPMDAVKQLDLCQYSSNQGVRQLYKFTLSGCWGVLRFHRVVVSGSLRGPSTCVLSMCWGSMCNPSNAPGLYQRLRCCRPPLTQPTVLTATTQYPSHLQQHQRLPHQMLSLDAPTVAVTVTPGLRQPLWQAQLLLAVASDT